MGSKQRNGAGGHVLLGLLERWGPVQSWLWGQGGGLEGVSAFTYLFQFLTP